MSKQLTAILAVGSLLGSEAVGEIDKSALYWMAAPDHNHTEIPESGASAFCRPMVDSGATATRGTTGLLNVLGLHS
jgi:hypothetical protein